MKILLHIGLISTQTPVIESRHSGKLTTESKTFSSERSGSKVRYFEEIDIRVNTSGVYTFKAFSEIEDTYGYIYITF